MADSATWRLAILHVVKASEKVVVMCLWALLVLCDKRGVCARKPVLDQCQKGKLKTTGLNSFKEVRLLEVV